MSSIMVLSQAIKDDRTDDFRKILESDILSTEKLDWLEYNLLLEACFYKRVQIVRFLLGRGCRVFYSMRSNTPLHLAVTGRDNLLIVDALLIRGASIAIKNEQGNTPLHAAFLNRSSDAIQDLLLHRCCRTREMNLVNDSGLSFLHIACSRANLEVVEHFIDVSESSDCVNRQVLLDFSTEYSGYTPLHFAVKSGSLETAILLFLRPGTDIHKQDANLSTPVHLACEMCDPMMIQFLLEHDKQMKNSVNISGLSHFMAACMIGDMQLVNAFLDAAEDPIEMVNGRVNRALAFPFAGFTPLHFAAENGHIEVVKRLLDVGAKIIPEECSALDMARRNKHRETAYVLYCQSVRCGAIQEEVN